ncbi:MAG: hypothetical protein L0387_43830 [Acidobacteria bacterium]|nr:hypothetical protein [Acidobacteriota bacterium]
MIYRSKDQTIALTQQLFQRVLSDLARVDPLPAPVMWHDLLIAHPAVQDPEVRFVPVVRDEDPPVKSGFLVGRHLKQQLRINQRWFIHARQIPSLLRRGIRVFFFIDDFLGTGDQFEEFIEVQGLRPHISAMYAAYVPLAAYIHGIKRIHKLFPGLRVRPVETLEESHSLFHKDSECFNDGVNTPKSAKTFYYAFLRKKGLKIYGPDRRGYGHLELAYAFEHAVPDNCLPILWWPQTSSWNPLFLR